MKGLRVKRALSVVILSMMTTVGAYVAPPVYADSGVANVVQPDAFDMITPTITIKGKTYHLFKQYVNKEEALDAFAVKHSDEIHYVQSKYKISQYLNKNNWQEYRNAIGGLSADSSKLNSMLNFLLYLDNTSKNERIKEKVAHNDFVGLEYLMPYFSKYVTDRLGKPVDLDKFDIATLNRLRMQSKQNRATSLPNMSAALSYASWYATHPNTDQYRKFSQDCTNFVSQILEAGGVRQVVYSDETKGWWHKHFHVGIADIDESSDSWRLADVFVRYMGLSYSTTDNYSFSSRLDRGTIIAEDNNRDGSWDHVAFVVDVQNHPGNYGGQVYYDYNVAQHTSDYLNWASSSENGWENVGRNGGTYGIVRQ